MSLHPHDDVVDSEVLNKLLDLHQAHLERTSVSRGVGFWGFSSSSDVNNSIFIDAGIEWHACVASRGRCDDL